MASQTSGAFTDLGKTEDLYYTDPDNCKVESIPVEYNTRFTQSFSNLGAGSSTFIIPPGNGLKHIVITLGYNAGNAAIAAQAGQNYLPKGWCYNAIRQVSYRIGGSSQYFLTGAQLLASNVRMVRTQTQAQALLDLGGSEFGTAAQLANYAATPYNIYGYVVVPIWCAPSADGLSVPLPADTLSQQVVITCELNPASQFWVNNGIALGGAALTPPPAQLDVATFTVEQLCMVDRGMAISNHVDLNTHELLMPVTYHQQELQIQVPANSNVAGGIPLTLTGFRSGQVKAIQCWLTLNRAGGTVQQVANDSANQLVWYAPQAVTVLYAGTIYAQYNSGSSAIFNLIDGTKPATVSGNLATIAPAGSPPNTPATSASTASSYVVLPFGNVTGDDFSAEVKTFGKPILNGLINLQLQAPDANPYTLHVQYIMNSTLVFSKSSCEFRF